MKAMRDVWGEKLVELGQSDLATDQEKALVLAVLDAGARMDGDGDDVTRFRAGMLVDEIVYVEDTEDDADVQEVSP